VYYIRKHVQNSEEGGLSEISQVLYRKLNSAREDVNEEMSVAIAVVNPRETQHGPEDAMEAVEEMETHVRTLLTLAVDEAVQSLECLLQEILIKFIEEGDGRKLEAIQDSDKEMEYRAEGFSACAANVLKMLGLEVPREYELYDRIYW
jgi:hypothetical protein